MKTLLTLLLLIPSLSLGSEIIYNCNVNKAEMVKKKGDSIIHLISEFDLKIHEDRYLVEFSTTKLVGAKFMAIANRPLYDKSKVVKAREFDGSYFMYFDGTNFALTKTDFDNTYINFATCRKLF